MGAMANDLATRATAEAIEPTTAFLAEHRLPRPFGAGGFRSEWGSWNGSCGTSAMIRRFNRYELKYVLPVVRAERIIDELRERMPEDSHSKGSGYRILSLYYDSPGLDCFWAKIEG